MVKRIIFSATVLFLIAGCCDMASNPEGEGMRSSYAYRFYEHHTKSLPGTEDKPVVYLKECDSSTVVIQNEEYTYCDTNDNRIFLVFFKEGRLAKYYFKPSDTDWKENLDDFEIANGDIGFYNVSSIDRLTVYRYSPVNCGQFDKSLILGRFGNERIILKYSHSLFSQYRRVDIPAEWLPKEATW